MGCSALYQSYRTGLFSVSGGRTAYLSGVLPFVCVGNSPSAYCGATYCGSRSIGFDGELCLGLLLGLSTCRTIPRFGNRTRCCVTAFEFSLFFFLWHGDD